MSFKPVHEAIFFIRNGHVYRQMFKSEFEALLDGYIGLSDMPDTEARLVYVVFDHQLMIRSLVLFLLYFDDDGRADPEWNLQIEELSQLGTSGPDLGAGPIRLVCRSQCPSGENPKAFWDPQLQTGMDDFKIIHEACQNNRLGLEPQTIIDDGVADVEIPTLLPEHPESEDSERAKEAVLREELEEKSEEISELTERVRIQRLKIRTLENKNDERIEQLERELRLEAQRHKNELQEVNQYNAQLQVLNEQLKKKLFDRNEQYLDLQDKMLEQSSLLADIQKQIRGQESADLQKQELASVRLELAESQNEKAQLAHQLDDTATELEQIRLSLEDAEANYEDLRNEGSLLERLKELDVVFMSYHPGAGHVTIPFIDIRRYAEKTIPYVASKCAVSEAAYRAWLEHYENPRCQHENANSQKCGQALSIVTNPADFTPGYSDHCAVHRRR